MAGISPLPQAKVPDLPFLIYTRTRRADSLETGLHVPTHRIVHGQGSIVPPNQQPRPPTPHTVRASSLPILAHTTCQDHTQKNSRIGTHYNNVTIKHTHLPCTPTPGNMPTHHRSTHTSVWVAVLLVSASAATAGARPYGFATRAELPNAVVQPPTHARAPGSGSHPARQARADAMYTTGGWPCIFPFWYGDVQYLSCTTVDNDFIPWCATAVDAGQNFVTDEWGECALVDNDPRNVLFRTAFRDTLTDPIAAAGEYGPIATCEFPATLRRVYPPHTHTHPLELCILVCCTSQVGYSSGLSPASATVPV